MMIPKTRRTIQLGTLTLVVSDHSFQQGYDIGFRQFQDLYQCKTMTDVALLDILLSNLAGVAHTSTHKIGLITGWYAALYGCDHHQAGEQS